MSTPNSPFNPARQVERIREILVGRQMNTVERRLAQIEHRIAPLNGRHIPPGTPPIPAEGSAPAQRSLARIERTLQHESADRRQAIAALANHIQESLEQIGQRVDACPPAAEFDERIGSLRDELRRDYADLRAELRKETRERVDALGEFDQRLAKLTHNGGQASKKDHESAIANLQASLEEWQLGFLESLQKRERWLIDQLRGELERMRAETWHWLGELHRSKVERAEFEARIPRSRPEGTTPEPWHPAGT